MSDPSPNGAAQLALLPATPPTVTDAVVPVDALPPDAELVGPAPDKALIASITALGVLEPLLLTKEPGREARLKDGKRRLKAARAAGLEAVPVRVVESRGLAPAVVGLTAHATRRENVADELADIEELCARGASLREIVAATHLPLGTIQKRLRLRGLHPALRAALAAGGVAPALAEGAARLPGEAQGRLAARYARRGKLTGGDVDAERRARVGDALAALPLPALADLPATTDPVGDALRHGALAGALAALVEAPEVAQARHEGEWLVVVLHDGSQRTITIDVR